MSGAFRINEDTPNPNEEVVYTDHTKLTCFFISFSLSMCITVDILQYSMPLAFLPSVLEDRGREPMEIATAVGVYYWTGFLGGAILTSYQLWRLITGRGQTMGEPTLGQARTQLVYLIIGLTIGTITLSLQAMHPHLMVHTMCRFVQGFAGAFIFFYTFLLSMNLFQEGQKVFAMTLASIALNVAEVIGGFLGAVIFDVWGQRAVFIFLAVMSLVNQILLIIVLYMVKGNGEQAFECSYIDHPPQTYRDGLRKVRDIFSRRFTCSLLLITTSAVVKASVEEMLPFHASHRWHMEPLKIGELFSVIALSYIASAAIAGQMWQSLTGRRTVFGASWLVVLGLSSWGVFLVATFSHEETVLVLALIFYGAGLGFTHTPAALLLADAIDDKEGTEKDAANGIWNTAWEAGGSAGFLLGGLLAENYDHQLQLLAAFASLCLCSAALMMLVSSGWKPKEALDPVEIESPTHKRTVTRRESRKRSKLLNQLDYGSMSEMSK